MRVIPLGVVTVRTPSSVMVYRQPGAWVFSRWCRRHRQHRFVAVGRPAVGVRDDVVEVGPAGPVAAAGMPAGAVAGA